MQAICVEAARAVAQGRPFTEQDAIAAGQRLSIDKADALAAWEVFCRQQMGHRRRLRNNRVLLVGSALLVVMGIVIVGTWRAMAPTRLTSAAATFQGKWDTNRGPLELVALRASGQLEGRFSYPSDGRQQAGVLRGVVRGNVFVATWEEKRDDGFYSGPAQFEMLADGQSFKGAWGDGRPPDPDGLWSGKRARLIP